MTDTVKAFEYLVTSLECFKKNCSEQMNRVKNAENKIYLNKRKLLNKLKLNNNETQLKNYSNKIRKLYTTLHLSEDASNEFNCQMSTCKTQYINVINIILDHILKRSDLKKSSYTLEDIITISKMTTELLIKTELLLIKTNINMAIDLNEKMISNKSSII